MLDLFKKPVVKSHVNPRFRAYGKARIDIARRATSRADWDQLWKRSTFPFPFNWGESWKQCIEYKVTDFAAEVGFFIDILGLPVNAFDPDYAMFTSPDGEFFFSVVPAEEGQPATPPGAIRIQFMVDNILELAADLERRGITFEHWPQPCVGGSSLFIGYFRTPHGIGIDLWGLVGDDFELDEEDISEKVDEDEPASEVRISRSPQLELKVSNPVKAEEASENEEEEIVEDDNSEDVEEEDEVDVEYEYLYEEDE
jgi:catechol 2,3-dioxygenase-like lactoylglutathione lyase family enzyme